MANTEVAIKDEVAAGESSSPSKADRATEVACKMLETGIKDRATRFAEIQKNEDMNSGKTGAALKGRNNVPFDCLVMSGYTDTLMSLIDEPVTIKFNRTREQDKMAADKVTAVFEVEMGSDKSALEDKILDAKYLSILSGRGFLKLFLESAPKFRSDLSVCDHYDMVTEAKGGGDLDKHMYKFQMNIFRTRQELSDGAANGFYDSRQVRLMMAKYTDKELFKKAEEAMNQKNSRWQSFGLDGNSYVGSQLYRLTEGVINFEGEWYYIVFSYETKTWVRFERLEEVFPHAKEYPGRGPWVSFAPHRHPFIFWSKAPADDVRPIAYTMKKIVNLTLDNLEKRNWDMTAYNPKAFSEPSQLLWREAGLVRVNPSWKEDIAKGIYKFQTPDTTSISINMTQWLDQFVGRKTGVTSDAEGAGTTDKATISINNLHQTSGRMTLKNKHFRKMYVDLGVIFDWGVHRHLREPYAVKLIGINGVNWNQELTREDADCDFSITVVSGVEEMEKNIAVNAQREKGFLSIDANPALFKRVNPDWYLRERFKNMGYGDDQIRTALDVVNDGDDLVMAKAAQAIQDCLEGKEYIQLFRGATTGFVRKILDFAADNFPLIPDAEIAKLKPSQQKKYEAQMQVYDRLVKYANDHVEIAQKNMERKLVQVISSGVMGDPQNTATPMAPAANMNMGGPALPGQQ